MFRADLPAPIEWRCTACGDEGVISGWEDSPYDLRQPGSLSDDQSWLETLVTDELAATLRGLMFLDMECERLVFQMRSSSDGIVLTAGAEGLDYLLGFVAANANHETARRRQRRLQAAFEVLTDALQEVESGHTVSPVVASQARESLGDTVDLTGRWRILEMDLWDREALDLVAPAFIEFSLDHTGRFGFIAVTGWIDWRRAATSPSGVEFSWEGADDGDQVSGRGWAALQNDGLHVQSFGKQRGVGHTS